MASFICFQRSGGAACWAAVPACATVFGASVVAGGDPGAAGGVLAFAGGALLASFVDDAVPGPLVESDLAPALASLVESMPAGLASESGGMAAGGDCMDTESCAGGWGAADASFAGSVAGGVEGVESLVATPPEESWPNSAR